MEKDLFKSPPDDKAMDPLERAAQEISVSVNELSDKLTDARKLKRLLDELIAHRNRAWPIHIKALCEKEKGFLKSLREKNHSAIPAVEALYREFEPKAGGAVRAIPGDMEQMAKAEGLNLDFANSRHPNYYFEDGGFIQVEVRDKTQEARIATREGSLAKIPADTAAIIAIVKQEKKRLFDRPFAGVKFLGDLRSAYTIVINSRKAADGDPIPLREIFQVMTQKIKARKGYKSDEFLVDLSRLVSDGPAETKGHCFELQQTKNTEEGMLLLGAAGRGMVNLLIFKKTDSLES